MYESQPSESSFVECFWHAQAYEDAEYPDTANETWSLNFSKRAGGAYSVDVYGPSLRARMVSASKGDEYWGIELEAHAIVSAIEKQTIVGGAMQLPVTGSRFELDGHKYEVPSYQDLESFVQTLVTDGLIASDTYILRSLHGDTSGRSERSRQRHFREKTGITQKQIAKLVRARYASRLLADQVPLAEVAAIVGYTDQPHMTRELQLLMGETPGAIRSKTTT